MNSSQQQKQKQKGGGGKHVGGTCTPKMLQMAMLLTGAALAGYIVGPPLYWHISDALFSFRRSSCPPCLCDCTSGPLLSLPPGLNSTFFTDCIKHDPEISAEKERNLTNQLTDELRLKESQALENHRKTDVALLEAKKLSSQYQKEADKCNSGMETCEEAREKAESALQAQRQITSVWELRARQKGWKDPPPKTKIKSLNIDKTQLVTSNPAAQFS
ncbi:uncharacterized protein LOC124916385 [Impatiens glandulifera]|uniref:uncharacterized protein LOC124916385 n=1 Tax=Impatiens glandulifera TaxID=253017 RepID=UPI001FB0FAA7|nr:uncharacterized protein LOC124916385 [Impatiens glandulifera]